MNVFYIRGKNEKKSSSYNYWKEDYITIEEAFLHHQKNGMLYDYGHDSTNINENHNKEEWKIKPVKIKNYEYRYKPYPTDDQVKALNFIYNYTGLIFEGITKEDARRFISENMQHAVNLKEGIKDE